MKSKTLQEVVCQEIDNLVCRNLDGTVISQKKLRTDIISQSQKLQNLSGRRVFIMAKEPYEFIVGFLAVLNSECEPVFLPSAQAGTIESFKSHYDAILNVHRDDDAALAKPQGFLNWNINSQTRLHFFTSGSTGEPKRVEKTLAEVEREVNTHEELWHRMDVEPETVSTVTHTHIYGLLFSLLWPFMMGRPFANYKVQYPEEFLRLEASGKPYFLVSSPAYLERVDASHPPLQNCVGIFSSGGVLSSEAAKKSLQILGLCPWEILGSTETGGVARRQQNNESDAELWEPLPQVQVQLSENSQQLLVHSPFTAASGQLMGDRAEILPSGKIRLLGRVDRVVKIEEKRVSLDEMESVLKRHPWVKECYILLLDGERKQVCAVLTLTPTGQSAFESNSNLHFWKTLRTHLLRFFEPVVLPRRFQVVPVMPRNSQGKLMAATMKELFYAPH